MLTLALLLLQMGSQPRACFSQVSSWSPGIGHSSSISSEIPYHQPVTNHRMLHRILAWPSLLLGLSAWINQHPLRTREGGTPPTGNLMHVPLSLVSRPWC